MTAGNLRIGVRLGAVFSILIAAMAALAIYGRIQVQTASSELQLLTTDRLVKLQHLDDYRQNMLQASTSLRDAVSADDQGDIARHKSSVDEVSQRNAALLAKLRESISSSEGKGRMQRLIGAREAYNRDVDRVLVLAQGNQDTEAEAVVLGALRHSQDEYFKALDGLADLQQMLAREAAGRVGELSDRAALHLLGGAGLAALIGVALAWWVTRSITQPLAMAVGIAERVAQGDLAQQITVTGQDEAGQLLQALARMTSQLSTVVNQVRSSSDSIATGSSEIANGNADLSRRTESQASSLQQTAASMEELHGTVLRNADVARHAGELALSASSVAQQGGEMMKQVVLTMGDIAQASHRIGDIIGVIDGIAFQTNILALNAAVEAARAGEQGRGFAVVASEVRELAQRSAEAAREIKQLISDSRDRVENGSQLVTRVGQTIGEIVEQVNGLSDKMQGLASAASEQTRGMSQINEAVSSLDHTTQQNAALVEQSAAATESLSNQARSLVEAVSVFRLR